MVAFIGARGIRISAPPPRGASVIAT
jgi:hypothetical protein